jgi:hypothetical protein
LPASLQPGDTILPADWSDAVVDQVVEWANIHERTFLERDMFATIAPFIRPVLFALPEMASSIYSWNLFARHISDSLPSVEATHCLNYALFAFLTLSFPMSYAMVDYFNRSPASTHCPFFVATRLPEDIHHWPWGALGDDAFDIKNWSFPIPDVLALDAPVVAYINPPFRLWDQVLEHIQQYGLEIGILVMPLAFFVCHEEYLTSILLDYPVLLPTMDEQFTQDEFCHQHRPPRFSTVILRVSTRSDFCECAVRLGLDTTPQPWRRLIDHPGALTPALFAMHRNWRPYSISQFINRYNRYRADHLFAVAQRRLDAGRARAMMVYTSIRTAAVHPLMQRILMEFTPRGSFTYNPHGLFDDNAGQYDAERGVLRRMLGQIIHQRRTAEFAHARMWYFQFLEPFTLLPAPADLVAEPPPEESPPPDIGTAPALTALSLAAMGSSSSESASSSAQSSSSLSDSSSSLQGTDQAMATSLAEASAPDDALAPDASAPSWYDGGDDDSLLCDYEPTESQSLLPALDGASVSHTQLQAAASSVAEAMVMSPGAPLTPPPANGLTAGVIAPPLVPAVARAVRVSIRYA